jgi:hypothetical protein
VDNLDDLSHPRRDGVTPGMLQEAATAVRQVGERLRGNAYPQHPSGWVAGRPGAARARCERSPRVLNGRFQSERDGFLKH